VFAEGGVVVLLVEMEEMFLRRLVVVLCENNLFYSKYMYISTSTGAAIRGKYDKNIKEFCSGVKLP
jgi:hypothetical protein